MSNARRELDAAPTSDPSRREIVGKGLKIAFVTPLISTFFASQAYAASYSCYPQGHTCKPPGQGTEDCCPGLQCTQVGQGGTCN